MYGRSTHATPVTRHIPLLLTVLASAAIHMLLLAAGWALIEKNQQTAQSGAPWDLVLGEVQSAIPPRAFLPPTPSSDNAYRPPAPEPPPSVMPDAGPMPVAEQIVTTAADARPETVTAATTPGDRRSEPAPLIPAGPVEVAASADPLAQLSEPLEPINELPSAGRPLSPQEQARVQQALDQLTDLDMPPASLTGETIELADGSQFVVDVQTLTAPGLTDLATYEVTLSQRQDGRIFSTRAIMRERAFSWYAKFINRWDTDVVLASDKVVGRFHANTGVNFSTDRRRQPVFTGPVSLAGYQGISWRLRNSGMFQQGVETGSELIAMPDVVVPTVFTLAETSLEVHQFEEHTRIEFLPDGGFRWSQPGVGIGVIRPAPGNAMLIVANDSAVLELSGVVSGVVSVFAPRRLSIIGNLTYAGGMAPGRAPQHFLTLISNGIIEVAAPAQTAPGDLEIQAALFARQRFSVRRFNSRPQGELIIRGTLVAGSVSATEPRYTTRIEYDSRFESVRPPAFPTTGLFDLDDWDQQWQITAVSDGSPAIAPDMLLPAAVE